MNKQRGGTVVGFIVGVLVGLGAALAVAVYVTKVPIPFMNKGQSRTAEQDEAETKKNKDWDPNAPLYGKNPSKAVPPASVPDPKTAVAKPPATAVVTKPEAKPSASPDPLGDLAKAKAAASAEADIYQYFVQVAAYRNPEDAESYRAKLSLSGIESKVTEREQSGRTVYRVRVGPFEKKDEGEAAKAKMDKLGLETSLVRVPREVAKVN
jgi:cell division protein FtsN